MANLIQLLENKLKKKCKIKFSLNGPKNPLNGNNWNRLCNTLSIGFHNLIAGDILKIVNEKVACSGKSGELFNYPLT